jgi:hypothetical protein
MTSTTANTSRIAADTAELATETQTQLAARRERQYLASLTARQLRTNLKYLPAADTHNRTACQDELDRRAAKRSS